MFTFLSWKQYPNTWALESKDATCVGCLCERANSYGTRDFAGDTDLQAPFRNGFLVVQNRFFSLMLIIGGQYSNLSLCYSACSLFYEWSFPFQLDTLDVHPLLANSYPTPPPAQKLPWGTCSRSVIPFAFLWVYHVATQDLGPRPTTMLLSFLDRFPARFVDYKFSVFLLVLVQF